MTEPMRTTPPATRDIDLGHDLDVYSTICTACARFDRERHIRTGERKCEAFREEDIPRAIWQGAHMHRRPFAGDHGLLRKPLETQERQ